MSDGESLRPRRAWQAAEDSEESTASDDTSASVGRRAQLGGDDESPAEVSMPLRAITDEDLDHEAEHAQANPFARPGSEEADIPIPAPVMPRSAGEYADSPSPAPRRSALSSTTPVTPEKEAAPAQKHWLEAHRDSLLKWAAGGLAIALLLVAVSFLIVRTVRDRAASATASPSVSTSSAPPVATTNELVTPEDLAPVASSSWNITATSEAKDQHEGRVACFQTTPQEPNPTTSLQRTLATTDETAALNRIDVFADADVAKEIFASRVANLSSCAEVPSHLISANKVAGLAEESFQITIEFQNEQTQYHTVLVTRSGAAVEMLDVTTFDSPVDAATPAEALTRSQTAIAEAQGLAAPKDVKVSGASLPAIEPVGWLTVSDLPRIRAGVGRWTMTEPTDLAATGMGCEDMTLASEPGPKTRQQATYLLTQDSAAPSTFGLDQMQFFFENKDKAKSFADKLTKSLTKCADRVNTAKVSKPKTVTSKVADVKATSTILSITQATSDKESVPYQLVVTRANDTVSYLLISAGADFEFSDGQLEGLADRVTMRSTQHD